MKELKSMTAAERSVLLHNAVGDVYADGGFTSAIIFPAHSRGEFGRAFYRVEINSTYGGRVILMTECEEYGYWRDSETLLKTDSQQELEDFIKAEFESIAQPNKKL